MNLIKIFVNPNRWLRDGFASMRDGSPYEFTRQWKENSPEPQSFSLQGAVAYFTEPDSSSRQKVMSRLSKAIEKHTGKNMYVAEFNNSPSTTFEDLTNVINIYNKLR